MDQFSVLASFVRSAEIGSFAAAARQLGISPAAVSKNVARLEERVGARLFQRTTRHLSLTDAGQKLLLEVGDSLDTIEQAVTNLADTVGAPSGRLRVSMGVGLGIRYIVPLIGEFLRQYPQISPDWHFDNRQVDLVGEGFDLAIGGGFELPNGVVALPLTPAHRVLVASPKWLNANRPILAPSDLATAPGIVIRSPQTGRVRSWALTHRSKGGQAALQLPPNIAMSDSEAACLVASQSLGVALVSMPFAMPYLESGVLNRVLPDWYVDGGNISIYYRDRRLLASKTRVFIDFLTKKFCDQGLPQRFDARGQRS